MRDIRHFSRYAAPLLVPAIVFGLIGCGQKLADKAAEKIVEKTIEKQAAKDGQKVKVDLSKGEMTVESKGAGEGGESFKMSTKDNSTSVEKSDGSKMVMGEAAAVPANFPKDVPLYEGMKLTMVAFDAPQEMFSISATTPDSVAKVADFYKEKAKANGWAEEVSIAQGGDQMYTLGYSKEKRNLNVMVMKTDEGTGIQITTGNK